MEPVSYTHLAFVACQGSLDHIDPQLVFKGVPSCRVFSTLSYSSLSCPFGCLGYGDCAEACPFDAIVVENGVARIDTAACTGCGTCAKICPVSYTHLDVYKRQVYYKKTAGGYDEALARYREQNRR